MKKQLHAVQAFHEAFELPISTTPTLLPKNYRLRYELMKEENEEYLKAINNQNIIEIADALTDMLYVLCGTLLEHGLQHKIEALFDEIHKSNMSKLAQNGKPITRTDGKVLKGPNYFKPNLHPLLENQ